MHSSHVGLAYGGWWVLGAAVFRREENEFKRTDHAWSLVLPDRVGGGYFDEMFYSKVVILVF